MALAKKLAAMKLKGQLGSKTLAGKTATTGQLQLNKPAQVGKLKLTGKQITGGSRG